MISKRRVTRKASKRFFILHANRMQTLCFFRPLKPEKPLKPNTSLLCETPRCMEREWSCLSLPVSQVSVQNPSNGCHFLKSCKVFRKHYRVGCSIVHNRASRWTADELSTSAYEPVIEQSFRSWKKSFHPVKPGSNLSKRNTLHRSLCRWDEIAFSVSPRN